MKQKRTRRRLFPSAPVPPALLSNAILVRLLQIDSDQNALIDKVADLGPDLTDLRADLIDVVLDAMQVPKDNTTELGKKYGRKAAKNRPEYFDRYPFIEEWCAKSGRTKREIQEYLRWVQERLATGWQ